MNKDDLSKEIAQKHNKTNQEMKDIIESIFDTIMSNLSDGNKVNIVGFGSFNTKKRKERMGRNPQTGERMKIEETNTASFQPGSRLKKLVRQH